ncbi:MAG TPA: exodeoxyribonuclease VII small subunit [Terriglobia bacterium]
MNQTAPPGAGAPGKSAKGDSFEKNLERLDAIVRDLEDAELPLEKTLELYEEGMRLTGICQQQLEAAEGRVEILRKRAGGRVMAEPFEDEEPKAP